MSCLKFRPANEIVQEKKRVFPCFCFNGQIAVRNGMMEANDYRVSVGVTRFGTRWLSNRDVLAKRSLGFAPMISVPIP